MFIDARTLPPHSNIESDVCIVGAGAAGITLAREFIGKPVRICLVEGGGFEFDKETQQLYTGDNIGLPYYSLDFPRVRMFGGTTVHWSGFCRPLEDLDMRERSWVPHSGWPLRRGDLAPCYERAQSVVGGGPLLYDGEPWAEADKPLLPFPAKRVRTQVFQISIPPPGAKHYHFGEIFRDEIERADNIRTLLFANIVEIETTENSQSVTRLHGVCLPGNRFTVSAKYYVLATGGIEVPRLMLVSNKVQKNGLANQNDLVGRFFADHPAIRSGFFIPTTRYLKWGLYSAHNVRGTKLVGALALTPEELEREQLLSFCALLEPVFLDEEHDPPGVKSARAIKHGLRQRKLPDDFISHVRKMISDGGDVFERIFYGRIKQRRAVPLFRLMNHPEAAPNPDSRVLLSTQRDRFGKPLARVDWRLTEQDKRTIRRAQEIIGEEAGKAGLGRVQLEVGEDDAAWSPEKVTYPWRGPIGGGHHMGTTRMGTDPKKGVVNPDCRVHGIPNLYVASSSVFPTFGFCNPTLTIVALAIRLGDHLKKQLTIL